MSGSKFGDPEESGNTTQGNPGWALCRDRDLLERWRDGDRRSGETLLAHYEPLFVKQCRRAGITDHEVLVDIWQEIVLRLLEKLSTLSQELRTSFGGFLCFEIRDVAKQRRRKWARVTDQAAAPEEGWASSSEDSVALEEALHQCGSALHAKEYRVFELRYVMGMSLKEVASKTDSNVNAVSQAILRLSRKMRACLESKGY